MGCLYNRRMNNELQQQTVPILDFGAQYVQLIARRVREAGVYSVLVQPDITVEELRALNPVGIILSGGPASVYEEGAPKCDPQIFDLGVPVLGICYGMQMAAQLLGGDVKPGRRGSLADAAEDSGCGRAWGSESVGMGFRRIRRCGCRMGIRCRIWGRSFVPLA